MINIDHSKIHNSLNMQTLGPDLGLVPYIF